MLPKPLLSLTHNKPPGIPRKGDVQAARWDVDAFKPRSRNNPLKTRARTNVFSRLTLSSERQDLLDATSPGAWGVFASKIPSEGSGDTALQKGGRPLSD